MTTRPHAPGAWERHILRRQRHPEYFSGPVPSADELAQARQTDQRELADFHQSLASLVGDMSGSDFANQLPDIKRRLDHCAARAFSLGADLSDQKNALTTLNEMVTSALRRALRENDEAGRMQLIKREGQRSQQLAVLENQTLADLLRTDSPIPANEIAGALLCEDQATMMAALSHCLDADQTARLIEQLEHLRDGCDNPATRQTISQRIDLAESKMGEPEPG